MTEAATLKTKKQINKGKLKKTMKNVICRPDQIFWPQTSDDEGKAIEEILNKHKLQITLYKKPSWSEISGIPKELRPKPPPIPRINGLIFGISECQKAIETKECACVLIETAVNPKSIVQPLMEMCTDKSIPVLCLRELRRISKTNFGIPTSALGVKQNCLINLENKVVEISRFHKPPTRQKKPDVDKEISISPDENEETMDVENELKPPYLYRTDSKNRVFTPSLNTDALKNSNKFEGQNFIQFSNNNEAKSRTDTNRYLKMIVKKISSNPNRKKITKLKVK